MGATIFPANEQPYENENGVTSYYLGSVVEPWTVDDPEMGKVSVWNPWEYHASYSTVYDVLTLLAYDTDTSDYGGSYDITEFGERIIACREAHRDDLDDRQLRLLDTLMRIVFYGLLNNASHIVWG